MFLIIYTIASYAKLYYRWEMKLSLIFNDTVFFLNKVFDQNVKISLKKKPGLHMLISTEL